MLGMDFGEQKREITLRPSGGPNDVRRAGFELVEEFSRRPDPALPNIPQVLADSFSGIGLGSGIEELLIGLAILHNGRGLSVNRQHHRTLGFLSCFRIAGAAPGRRQRLTILGDVKPA